MSNDGSDSERSEAVCPTERPMLSGDLPNVGGRIKVEPEDFEVREIPAYEPSGEGPHYYLRVEKRDVDGRSMVDAIAGRYGVQSADIGTAGIKDRRAVTRQWVSIPAHSVEEPTPGNIDEGLEVLRVSRHRNKLGTGHLNGNHFSVWIRNTDRSGTELREAVESVRDRVDELGLPNYYGLQRFGNNNSTLRAGLKWLVEGDKPRTHFLRKMAASAVQSEVFNRVLKHRLEADSWKTVVDGDIFEKTDTGGRFWIDASEREETQRRLKNREIVVTGPMPGSKRGLADGRAGEIEREHMAQLGISEEDVQAFGRRGRGTRRPLTIYIDELDIEVDGRDVRLDFELPAGSYATVLMREFMGDR